MWAASRGRNGFMSRASRQSQPCQHLTVSPRGTVSDVRPPERRGGKSVLWSATTCVVGSLVAARGEETHVRPGRLPRRSREIGHSLPSPSPRGEVALAARHQGWSQPHRRARPGWPSVSKPRPREGEGTTLTFTLTCAASIWASPERQEALCNLQAPRRTRRPLESPGEPSIGAVERTAENRQGWRGKVLTGWIAGRGALGSGLGGSAGPGGGRLGWWASADPLPRMGGWGGGLVHPEKITQSEAPGGGVRPLILEAWPLADGVQAPLPQPHQALCTRWLLRGCFSPEEFLPAHLPGVGVGGARPVPSAPSSQISFPLMSPSEAQRGN